MKEFYTLLEANNITLYEVKHYESQMPPKRKAIHQAICGAMEFEGMHISKIARELKIDRGKVYRMFYGKDVDFLPGRWAKEEDAYIRKNYKKKTYKQIAENLQRTDKAVGHRVRALGLNKKK